jgi:SAM-dependent methyltransferase
MSDYENYFSARGVSADDYLNCKLPAYFNEILPPDKGANILDFGCGFGQTIRNLKNIGYENVRGYDIEPNAIQHCLQSGYDVFETLPRDQHFDLIIMSHVLEHFDKNKIISTLVTLREMLSPSGKLFLCVPNAQSNTGCYWAYEDFTHNLLFTSGSLLYVLRQAGFKSIVFIDPECLSGASLIMKLIRKLLLNLYKGHVWFWNMVTGSSFHKSSPQIFSYEIKVLAGD